MVMLRVRRSVGRSWPGQLVRSRLFPGSGSYWEKRYASGGTSGSGSYGAPADWKAEVVNAWVAENAVTSVIDLGCGDGNQLSLARYPRYLGMDRSPTAVRNCIARFADDATKSFLRYDPDTAVDPAGWLKADLALSLEVLFHLVEQDIHDEYLRRLFDSAERFVVICAADRDDLPAGPHERYRRFTPWIQRNAPQWELVERRAAPEGVAIASDLYLYGRSTLPSA